MLNEKSILNTVLIIVLGISAILIYQDRNYEPPTVIDNNSQTKISMNLTKDEQTLSNSAASQETYVGNSTFSIEQLAGIKYDKSTVANYTNSKYGFSFDYPKGWVVNPGLKMEGSNYTNLIYNITLINTKDFPTRGKQIIEIWLTSDDQSEFGGGEGVADQHINLVNTKNGKPMYFSLYHSGEIGDFYDHDQSDKAWFDKFQAEAIASHNDFGIISASLKAK